MSSVYRHELHSFFSGLTGYVFCAFYLLFAGIYTMVYNLKNCVANFEYVPGSMSFVFMIIIPVLTMRTFSEERRQKTDLLLYSLPIPLPALVAGKYLALLTVMFLPSLIMGFYPVFLSAFGTINFASAYSAVAGFFLLGAALAAIGMYISSVTENLAVSAFLCFITMLVNYFLSALSDFVSDSSFASYAVGVLLLVIGCIIMRVMTANVFSSVSVCVVLEFALTAVYVMNTSAFEGLFPSVMQKLSLFERFYGFVDGVFDLTGVVFFLGVAFLFCYLTLQTLEKRRWSD